MRAESIRQARGCILKTRADVLWLKDHRLIHKAFHGLAPLYDPDFTPFGAPTSLIVLGREGSWQLLSSITPCPPDSGLCAGMYALCIDTESPQTKLSRSLLRHLLLDKLSTPYVTLILLRHPYSTVTGIYLFTAICTQHNTTI